MTQQEFKNLRRGDIVADKDGDSYVIEQAYDYQKYIGVSTVTITNPDEWEKINR